MVGLSKYAVRIKLDKIPTNLPNISKLKNWLLDQDSSSIIAEASTQSIKTI